MFFEICQHKIYDFASKFSRLFLQILNFIKYNNIIKNMMNNISKKKEGKDGGKSRQKET